MEIKKNFCPFSGITILCLFISLSITNANANTLGRIKETGITTVCADPANLPLSDSKLNPPGYDIEIANEIAKSLNAKLQYNWFATAVTARVLRQLNEEKCDFIVGMPNDKRLEGGGPKPDLSKPYTTTGFVLVVAKNRNATNLNDIKDNRIGVEMHSVPDFVLHRLGYDRSLYASQSEIFKAVADGEVVGGMMWAPMAGWLAKQQPSANVKILGENQPEFKFPLAVAVRKNDPEFLDLINKAIDKLITSGKRNEILDKYSFPSFYSKQSTNNMLLGNIGEPKESNFLKELQLITNMNEFENISYYKFVSYSKSPLKLAVGGSRKTLDVQPFSSEAIEDGFKLYHSACGKCHGRNVISGGIFPDLRKYEGSQDEFMTTVKDGRTGTPMPAWKNVFSDEELLKIRAYIKSVDSN